MELTYEELVTLYGKQTAYVALQVIERSAKIRKSKVVPFDCEKRLRCAFDAMRDNELAA